MLAVKWVHRDVRYAPWCAAASRNAAGPMNRPAQNAPCARLWGGCTAQRAAWDEEKEKQAGGREMQERSGTSKRPLEAVADDRRKLILDRGRACIPGSLAGSPFVRGSWVDDGRGGQAARRSARCGRRTGQRPHSLAPHGCSRRIPCHHLPSDDTGRRDAEVKTFCRTRRAGVHQERQRSYHVPTATMKPPCSLKRRRGCWLCC